MTAGQGGTWKSRTKTAFYGHLSPNEEVDPGEDLLRSGAKLTQRLEGLQALLKQAQCVLQEDLSLAQSAQPQQARTDPPAYLQGEPHSRANLNCRQGAVLSSGSCETGLW